MTTVVVFTADSLAELARLDEAADSEMRSPEAAVAPHSNRVGATSVEEAQQLRDAITTAARHGRHGQGRGACIRLPAI